MLTLITVSCINVVIFFAFSCHVPFAAFSKGESLPHFQWLNSTKCDHWCVQRNSEITTLPPDRRTVYAQHVFAHLQPTNMAKWEQDLSIHSNLTSFLTAYLLSLLHTEVKDYKTQCLQTHTGLRLSSNTKSLWLSFIFLMAQDYAQT
jgi:hypothetical protein